jgi:hypothetical protein
VTDPSSSPAPGPEIPPLDDAYRKQVSKRFSGVLEQARDRSEPPLEIDEAKIVVFSDHHKGARDGADDFQRCERGYCAALGYYLEAGFKLLVLGDAEELWEEKPAAVIGCYREVLELEAEFSRPGRGGLVRFFGNHDDLWDDPRQVERHLAATFSEIEVREALHVPLTDGGVEAAQLLFAHGHQGTSDSDKWGRWSRLPIRYIWRPLQRKFGFSATTPASDFRLRGTHDRAMFEWALEQPSTPPLVLITGHTHRPVFSLPDPPARSVSAIAEELAAASGDRIAMLRAELEHAKATRRDRNGAALTVKPPCYFNAGCCSFPDGDITGLEIVGGEIRLVRWPDDDENPLPRHLGVRSLREVFAEIGTARPGQSEILEQVV